MASNGFLTPSELSPIPGGELSNNAADAWNSPGGPADSGCAPGGPESSYRDFRGQELERRLWCSRGNCSNAAMPGTSNHGLGLCVDDPDADDQQWLLTRGGKYGWAKTEAFSEPWHFNFVGNNHVYLRRGSRGHWVRVYRNRLKRLGYVLPGNRAGFGPLMQRAVKKFQKRHHLPATGVIDGTTAYHINRRIRNEQH